MNLSTKQIRALSKEIYPEVRESQRKQLEKVKEELTDSVTVQVNKLNLPFNLVSGMVTGLVISRDILNHLGINSSYIASSYESQEKLIVDMVSKMIKERFNKLHGEEITLENIEHEIVLSTIGADDIKQIIQAVKDKLLR